MRQVTPLAVLVVLLQCYTTHSIAGTTDCSSDHTAWQQYKQRHNKNYSSSSEETKRCAIWRQNKVLIASHNSGNATYRLADNHLSDRTPDEYQLMLGFRSRSDPTLIPTNQRSRRGVAVTESPACVPGQGLYTGSARLSGGLPLSVNWTARGWVNPVQSQGDCGDCWAFSACGALEAQYFNVTGTSMIMSEQNLLDCSTAEGDEGCVEGGDMTNAFCYVYLNGGIDSYAAYPYTASKLSSYTPTAADCKYAAADSVAKISGWMSVLRGSESTLQQAVALIGPISVGINASPSTFKLYSSGLYSDSTCAPSELSHAALLVGYGTTADGHPYWLIKNNWGTNWGMAGYMLLARNAGNMCGVATQASFPVGLQPLTPSRPPPTAVYPSISSSGASLHMPFASKPLQNQHASTATPYSNQLAATSAPTTVSVARSDPTVAIFVVMPPYLYQLNGLVVAAAMTSLLTSWIVTLRQQTL